MSFRGSDSSTSLLLLQLLLLLYCYLYTVSRIIRVLVLYNMYGMYVCNTSMVDLIFYLLSDVQYRWTLLSYVFFDSIEIRDLKPTNIGLCAQGHVKVYDFGLSALREVRGGRDNKYQVSCCCCLKKNLSCCCCRCFFHSAYWLPTRKKLLIVHNTVANPARGLPNREKRTKEKIWQHTPPPPLPHTARSEKNK